MKPIIQNELDALRRRIDDLETRLKDSRTQLGHREIFSINRHGEVPAPTPEDRGKILSVEGWITGSGGGGGGLSTVYTDGVTVGGDGSALYPISASLLSATLDARIKNLSGSIDGRFIHSGFLTSVYTDSTLSGDGTGGNPLSAAPGLAALSGTINAALLAFASGTQIFTYYANGGEGIAAGVTLPRPYTGTGYRVYLTKVSGSGVGAYQVPVQSKTSASFIIVSTQPFRSGDAIDVLTVTGSFGPMADVSSFTEISGSFASSVVTGLANLSGTINSAIIRARSGTVVTAIDVGGGKTSYLGTTPLVVGSMYFDASTNANLASSTSSIYFRAIAAVGVTGTVGYAQLYNLSDSYSVCTASFTGTATNVREVSLSVGGTGDRQLPSGPKLYEVRVYVSATLTNGSIELYSAQLRSILELK